MGGVRFSAGTEVFAHFHTGSDLRLASYARGTGGTLPGVMMDGTWTQPVTSNHCRVYECIELTSTAPYIFMVWYLINYHNQLLHISLSLKNYKTLVINIFKKTLNFTILYIIQFVFLCHYDSNDCLLWNTWKEFNTCIKLFETPRMTGVLSREGTDARGRASIP
jgi:hypothetical protein